MNLSAAHLQLAAAVLLNTASYIIYKSIVGAAPAVWWPLFIVGLGLGAANTFLYARSIEVIQLSVAYTAFSGASFAIIALASLSVFDEHLSAVNVIGIGLVVIGIMLATR